MAPPSNPDPHQPAKKVRTFGSLLPTVLSLPNQPSDINEFRLQLSCYVTSQDGDRIDWSNPDPLCALAWWHRNEERYYLLAKAAQKYLAIPAGAANVERIWSLARNILGDNKKHTGAALFQKLVFMKSNLAKYVPPKDHALIQRLYSDTNE